MVHIYNAMLLNDKRDGSFVEMQMNLESIIQSKVTQKDKNKYVLTYMWNLEKLYKALFFFFFKLGTSVVTDQ